METCRSEMAWEEDLTAAAAEEMRRKIDLQRKGSDRGERESEFGGGGRI